MRRNNPCDEPHRSIISLGDRGRGARVIDKTVPYSHVQINQDTPPPSDRPQLSEEDVVHTDVAVQYSLFVEALVA